MQALLDFTLRLPPLGTQAGSVAPVQHAGHAGPQAGQGELHPELPPEQPIYEVGLIIVAHLIPDKLMDVLK